MNVSVDAIRARRICSTEICSEVVQLLQDRPVTPKVFGILRRIKPLRQIEAAEHMMAGWIYTIPFAKALLTVTKPEMLDEPPSPRKLEASSNAARAMLSEQNEFSLKNLKSVEDTYETEVLALTVLIGYIERLLENPRIARYLERNHFDILQTLKRLMSEARPAASELVRRAS